jgi:hypothetical protein
MVRHAGPKADRCECTRLDNGTEAFLLVTSRGIPYSIKYISQLCHDHKLLLAHAVDTVRRPDDQTKLTYEDQIR